MSSSPPVSSARVKDKVTKVKHHQNRTRSTAKLITPSATNTVHREIPLNYIEPNPNKLNHHKSNRLTYSNFSTTSPTTPSSSPPPPPPPPTSQSPMADKKRSTKHVRTMLTNDWLADIVNNNLHSSNSDSRVDDGTGVDESKPTKAVIVKCPVIQLTDVTIHDPKAITNEPCFESLNVSFVCGQIFAIIGSRHTGKSALLRTVAKIVPPTKGKVKYLSVDPGHHRLSTGYMPQHGGFFYELTPVENLHYLAQVWRVEPLVVHEKLHRLMQMIGWDKKGRSMGSLKPSDQTLVSLALASLHSPAILVLDEPHFGADLFLKEHVWRQLKRLTRLEYVTIIFSTSSVENVRFADEAAIVRGHSLVPCTLNDCQQTGKLCSGQMFEKEVDASNTDSLQEVDIQNLLTVDVDKIRRFMAESYSKDVQFDCTDETTDANGEKKAKSKTRNGKRQSSKVNKAFEMGDDDIRLNMSPFWSTQKEHYRKGKLKRTHREQPLWIKLTLVTVLMLKLAIMKRPLYLVGQLLVPALMVATFHYFVGQNPYDIGVAVFNPDVPPIVSRHVLNSMDKHTIRMVEYRTLEEALNAVKQHQAWAAIEFPHNYTNSMINRALQNCDSNTDDFEDEPEAETISGHLVEANGDRTAKLSSADKSNVTISAGNHTTHDNKDQIEKEDTNFSRGNSSLSGDDDEDDDDDDSEDLANDLEVNRHKTKPINMITIRIYVDNTNLLVSGFVKGKMFQALQRAQRDASVHQFSPKLPSPLEIVSPNIYGEDETPMSEFLLPGTLVSVFFLCGSIFPLVGLCQIQRHTIFQVLQMAGISQLMLVCTWTVIQLAVLLAQIVICVAVLAAISHVAIGGVCLITSVLLYVQGSATIVGTVVTQTVLGGNGLPALVAHLTYFSLLLVFGGLFWPLECLPQVVQLVMFYLPQPVSAESLRYVFSRGWTFQHYHNEQNMIIWKAVNIPTIWLLALTTLAVLVIKFKQH